MSLVVALREGAQILVVADSAATDPETGYQVPVRNAKVRAFEDKDAAAVVIGGAGSQRDLMAVRRALSDRALANGGLLRPRLPLEDAEAYVRGLLRPIFDGPADPEWSTSLLIGLPGGFIVEVTPELSVFEIDMDYAAVGSGAEMAVGVLSAPASGADAAVRAYATLRTVARYNAFVGAPFRAFSTAGIEEVAVMPHTPLTLAS